MGTTGGDTGDPATRAAIPISRRFRPPRTLVSFIVLQRFTAADTRRPGLGGCSCPIRGVRQGHPRSAGARTSARAGPVATRVTMALLVLTVVAGAHLILITSASAAAYRPESAAVAGAQAALS